MGSQTQFFSFMRRVKSATKYNTRENRPSVLSWEIFNTCGSINHARHEQQKKKIEKERGEGDRAR